MARAKKCPRIYYIWCSIFKVANSHCELQKLEISPNPHLPDINLQLQTSHQQSLPVNSGRGNFPNGFPGLRSLPVTWGTSSQRAVDFTNFRNFTEFLSNSRAFTKLLGFYPFLVHLPVLTPFPGSISKVEKWTFFRLKKFILPF